MLTQLSISNFAIVDQLDLDIHCGMTVITGETGAGKSIMLDALGLATGDRTDSHCVRQGTDKAEIHASFDISQCIAAKAWLQEKIWPVMMSVFSAESLPKKDGPELISMEHYLPLRIFGPLVSG